MSKRLRHFIKLIFLLSFTLILITACNSKLSQNALYLKTKLVASECRVVKHSLGETCVPLNPQRLIVMDEQTLEAVLALGIKPIAAAENNWVGSRRRQFGSKAEGILSLGKNEQPNLERMVQLHPDFILGMNFDAEKYQLFSKIAPTVIFDDHITAWKKSFMHIGEALGKSRQAQEVLAEYEQRVRQFQDAMGERLKKTEVSISRFYAGSKETEFRTIFSFPGNLLMEAGLTFPQKQRELTQSNFVKTSSSSPTVRISLENLNLLDADLLFIALDPGSERNFKSYQKSQLWQRLNVVKNNQVHIVDSGYWIFGNILSANAILDDLNKYLLNKSNTNLRK